LPVQFQTITKKQKYVRLPEQAIAQQSWPPKDRKTAVTRK